MLQATGISEADLKRNLQSLALVKGKNVLKKEPMSREIGEQDVFSFNEGFTSKFFKVRHTASVWPVFFSPAIKGMQGL